ncbi:DUF2508 family protein [Paenibacillus validus]|uniref:DUF2508 family protein n=1 Tax=Paenibacillus TaxID=44249 RepID=UPI0006CF3C27|nr:MULTISPECIES: DUF2508 family protein [Paenibacillus]MED4601964.1 DUF2508 family protein [Paenibacillus validus]MED4607923.1 DUF2508 family protein [Paenibacillus validus]
MLKWSRRGGFSWWGNGKRKEEQAALFEERVQLVEEIRRAHMEWEVAERRFHYAVEKEQIDYAIYALEAAEKRFEMLIKQAKNIHISAAEVCASRVREGSS